MKTDCLYILFLSSLLWAFLPAQAQYSMQDHLSHDSRELLLWPDKAPGSENLDLAEHILERSSDTLVHNRAINSIDKPGLEIYLPEHPNGSAILICPGGAYSYLSYDKEGVDIARWLNSLGYTACILKYRLPAEGHAFRNDVPLMDAQRAIRLIRSNAIEWGLSSANIGVIGFSAGGHLASSLGTLYNRKVHEHMDQTDQISARPDFLILVYPVISMTDSITHAGSKNNLLGDSPADSLVYIFSTNLQVTSETPSTFIVHASDDGTVEPENSLLFYRAILQANVPAEMHIFEKGGHGFGIRQAEGPVGNWTKLCEEWLQNFK